MAKHIAQITLTRAGGFPQQLELGQGNTVVIGDGVATATKIAPGTLTLSYERDGAAPLELVVTAEKPAELVVNKAPIATLTLVSITTAQE